MLVECPCKIDGESWEVAEKKSSVEVVEVALNEFPRFGRVGGGDKVIVEPVLLDFSVETVCMRVRVLLRINSASRPAPVRKGEDGWGSPEGPKVLASGEGATGLR